MLSATLLVEIRDCSVLFTPSFFFFYTHRDKASIYLKYITVVGSNGTTAQSVLPFCVIFHILISSFTNTAFSAFLSLFITSVLPMWGSFSP